MIRPRPTGFTSTTVEIRDDGSLVASYSVPPLPYEADREPYGEQSSSAYLVDPLKTEREADLRLLDRKVPGRWLLLAGAREVVALPFWVSELHVLIVLVALVLWTRAGYLLVLANHRKKE